MQETTTSTERYNFFNTLTGLVKALENKSTIIDLRNESCVSGLIKKVDGHMNLEMENVIFYNPRGNQHRFSNFFVSARNIRYVHIPKEYSMTELMESQIRQLECRNKQTPALKPDNRKTRRAQQYNQDILSRVYGQSSGPESVPGPSHP